jgi:hypothetical protein
MEVSQLRIRNLVYKNGIATEITVDIMLEILRYTTPFEPIPLTEEWLLKFGCEKVKSDIPTFSIVYGEFIEDDYEHCLIINLDVDNNFYIVIKGVKLILKYVHQLQNLYFALTGEELTIKNRKL